MVDPNEFAEIAEHILNTVVSTFDEYETDLPERRYLSVGGLGTTVHDCEQVTVSFEQAYSGLPGSQAESPARCSSPRTGVYIVEIVRSVPINNVKDANPDTVIQSRFAQETKYEMPRADVQTEVALKQMRDAALLMEAGLRAGETTLTGSLADVSAGQPQGGLQAMILTLTTSALSSTGM